MAMAIDDPNAPNTVGPSPAAAPAPPEPPKPAPAPAAPAAAPVPPQIEDFDALVKGDVQNFVDLAQKIGGLVEEQVRQFGAVSLVVVAAIADYFHSPKRFWKLSMLSVPISMSRQRLRSPNRSLRSS
jgi:hypothetical protein